MVDLTDDKWTVYCPHCRIDVEAIVSEDEKNLVHICPNFRNPNKESDSCEVYIPISLGRKII